MSFIKDILSLTDESINVSKSFSLDTENAKADVVIFHGLTGTPGEMEDLASFIHQAGYSVSVPCLSGHREKLSELKRTTSKEWFEDSEKEIKKIKDSGKSIILVGVSFGALLCLYLAGKYPERIKGVVLMSPPLKLYSSLKEFFSNFLSYFPDFILNCLGVLKKKERSADAFFKPRQGFSYHSISSVSRLVQVRRRAQALSSNINSPVLILFDPEDHHLSSKMTDIARRLLKQTTLEIEPIANGQHELMLGHKYEKVFKKVLQFIDNH